MGRVRRPALCVQRGTSELAASCVAGLSERLPRWRRTRSTEVDPGRSARPAIGISEPSSWQADHHLVGCCGYGLPEEQARPTLLAAGPLGAAAVRRARRRSPSLGRDRPVADHLRVRRPGHRRQRVTGIQLPFATGRYRSARPGRGRPHRRRPRRQRPRPECRADVLRRRRHAGRHRAAGEGAGAGSAAPTATGTSVRIVDGSGHARRRGPDRDHRVSAEPASVTAMRQLVAEARLRRSPAAFRRASRAGTAGRRRRRARRRGTADRCRRPAGRCRTRSPRRPAGRRRRRAAAGRPGAPDGGRGRTGLG